MCMCADLTGNQLLCSTVGPKAAQHSPIPPHRRHDTPHVPLIRARRVCSLHSAKRILVTEWRYACGGVHVSTMCVRVSAGIVCVFLCSPLCSFFLMLLCPLSLFAISKWRPLSLETTLSFHRLGHDLLLTHCPYAEVWRSEWRWTSGLGGICIAMGKWNGWCCSRPFRTVAKHVTLTLMHALGSYTEEQGARFLYTGNTISFIVWCWFT